MDVMSSRSSATELEHDFLWRTKRDLPKRGRFGIFNRPYYEEVLIVRVHRGILNSEDIPDAPHHYGKLWHDRYRSIRDLELHLHAMEPSSSSSSSISRRKSSCNGSWRVSTNPTRTGRSAGPTSRRESSGSSTERPTRSASARPARMTRPGLWCRPATKRTRG